MSFNHHRQMEINDIEDYDNSVNESFCIDESSNDFSTSLQVSSKPSIIVSHAQIDDTGLPAHKTRSGLKYNTSKESNSLKRVNSSASCSFTGDESPSPSKMINSDTMTVIVRNELIPNISHDREEVSQDVEDDEDVPMEYDAEDQNESHDSAVSSPQTNMNKYKIINASEGGGSKLSENKCTDHYVIDDSSLISSTLSSYNLQENHHSINNSKHSFTQFTSSSSIEDNTVVQTKGAKSSITQNTASTSQSTYNKPMQTRQMRHRVKRINMKPNRKIMKPSKALFNNDKPIITNGGSGSIKHDTEDSIFLIPRYPLRSRARLEKVKTRLRESVVGSKTLETLPVELYYRIFQYLPIQDLFRIQRVNRRFKEAVENHLVMVKRINFSCGLPFAFLPDCLNDFVLKRILSKTPEVTHILGFYPRKIEDVPGISNSLTYSGIMIGLRQCTKLRSVEIMDLELMSRVVHALSRVKFHGMFRNRPYSWEDEYANPLLNKNSGGNSNNSNNISVSTTNVSSNATSVQLFENTDMRQSSSKYGLCNKLTALKSLCNLVSLQQVNSKNLHINFINYSWLGFLEKMGYTPIGQGLPLLQPINQGPVVNLVTPIPPSIEKLIIPTTINNLTKLDLVSVCIQHLPRLENIKYLHLKWVRFSSPDPFTNFQAPKIQSFVMNNCIGPIRGMRYVRIFTALARSTQLNRLELVSTRIVEGLFENFFLDTDQGHRCFRNLQRLVLASNKEFGEVDVAALLLSSHASLNHLALSVSHSRNSLMLSLANAKVTMQKLESVILGYQDPFQSMLTGIEIHNLGLHDSPDHSLPICKITDRGIAALMKLAPKLISLHLRHAIYVEDPMIWLSKNWPYPIGNKPTNLYENNDENKDQLANTFPLKSLTLENCPGIKPETISFILNHPATCFPQLEMLVLRDMFPPLPRCFVAQADIDHSIFNNCFNTTNRKQNQSMNNVAKNLSCRGKLIMSQTINGDLRIRNHIIEGLNERFCSLPPIVSPGGVTGQMHDSFNINSGAGNNSSLNVGDIMDNTNSTQNRLPRIFIPTLTPNDIRFSTNDSGMFGMGSSGLALYNAAGAQVLGAQHTNLGASIRQNEFLRPSMIINAMKSISMMHKLENLGLGRLVLWDGISPNSNRSENETFNVSLSEVSSKHSNAGKRKRSRSNDKFSNNQSVNGIYFHKSMVGKLKKSKKETLKSDKPMKKRRISDKFGNNSISSSFDNDDRNNFDFQSTGTQTCVCGYIDWHDATWQRDISICDDSLQQEKSYQSAIKIHRSHDSQPNSSTKSSNIKMSSASIRTAELNLSDYECRLCSFPIDNFNNDSTISYSQPECHLKHRPREWEAQDASVDTMSLRIYLKPQFYSLDLKQNTFAHLTTLHLEKVGITHLVLASCHRLKSITLENCPELQAIVINSGTAPPSDSMPNLRRIRIMRCQKFAIYNLLYQVTRFYPQHDDNLYITYRPFGEYNHLVEKALWINSESQHVMVSHEYRQASSERNLEELCSSFDQLFREMLNFSESLIRRDILTVSDFSRVNYFTNGSFLRSEHGTDWDLLTDIPWISEVCCSMLPSDLTRTQQADQLYELLSEIQSHLGHMKLRRRGIHFHVQFRDVHKPTIIDESSLINEILPNDKQFSYLPCAYTDSYLETTRPRDDINANYCEPNINDLFSDYSQDQSDFDFISDPSMFPSHLRDLLDGNTDDEITFGADINEKVPIPQQFQTEKISKSNNLTSQSRTNSSSFRSNHSEYDIRNQTMPGASGNVNDSSSAEYMSNKIHKFRSTITALKKSDSNVKVMTSANEIAELAHSTRSNTAEMILNSESKSRMNNNQHFRPNRH